MFNSHYSFLSIVWTWIWVLFLFKKQSLYVLSLRSSLRLTCQQGPTTLCGGVPKCHTGVSRQQTASVATRTCCLVPGMTSTTRSTSELDRSFANQKRHDAVIEDLSNTPVYVTWHRATPHCKDSGCEYIHTDCKRPFRQFSLKCRNCSL